VASKNVLGRGKLREGSGGPQALGHSGLGQIGPRFRAAPGEVLVLGQLRAGSIAVPGHGQVLERLQASGSSGRDARLRGM
jgi:hypothetical protein